MDDLEGSRLTRNVDLTTWVPPSGTTIKINYDGAFDKQRSQLASGVVARNGEGRVLIVRSKLHKNVGSAFAAAALACLCAIQTGTEMEIAAYIRNIHPIAEHFRWIHFRHIKKGSKSLCTYHSYGESKKGSTIIPEWNGPWLRLATDGRRMAART
ncbi:hypothetical protein Goarm_019219 [Gossypium armourianum]|uniref:RNase H type-1 domain-containing protein n=1 Tax=Gossypium armourianum TaxID=34283 RepID=A0A7J9IMJ4_9ROSI|nr:hypothetical protein [Gossypium armourianum]